MVLNSTIKIRCNVDNLYCNLGYRHCEYGNGHSHRYALFELRGRGNGFGIINYHLGTAFGTKDPHANLDTDNHAYRSGGAGFEDYHPV